MKDVYNFLTNYNTYGKKRKIIKINKNLYIGGLLSTHYIEKYNIDIIINLNMETIYMKFSKPVLHMILPDRIKKQDVSKYKIMFQEIGKIISEYQNAGMNILIYCLSGICKSPTIIIYLEMQKNNTDLLSILKKLKNKNSWICPSINYLQFLLLNFKE